MLYLNINREYGIPLIKQIYEQIRMMILNGILKAKEKLPSTRKMADILNISRNTVTEAYEMLISEGYLTSIPGSGIFISHGIDFIKTPEKVVDYSVTAYSSDKIADHTISFHSGTPALDLFPRSKWNKIARQTFNDAPVSAFGYDYPQGRPELRNILSGYLKKTRGIICHPEQIIITTGTKQALSLVAKCLIKQGSEVCVEDPTNINVRTICSYHTDFITPIPVDNEGIKPEFLPQDRCPVMMLVTPSHQFPLGGILTIQRRIELIRYARKTGCYIVEDDYDSEFRYNGLPVTSLHELDNEKVIYIGTFSKILFPSLRIGYIVLPDSLIEQFREWKRLGDHHTNSLNQLTLMHFIEKGEMERHIARMKRIYRTRCDTLIRCMKSNFSDKVRITGEKSGMHIVAEFPEIIFTVELLKKMKKEGVNVLSIEEHTMNKGNHIHKIALGYAHLCPEDIEEGILRLKKAIM